MAAADGVRLATRVLRPADASVRRGTVLIRSERPLARRIAPAARSSSFARWLAEDGRTVAIQSCRGRGDSEGEFRAVRGRGRGRRRRAALDRGPAVVRRRARAARRRLLRVRGVGGAVGARARRSAAIATPGSARAIRTRGCIRGGVLQLEAALALAARLDGRTGYDPVRSISRAPRATARSANATGSRCASSPRSATGSRTPSATRGGASARPRCRNRRRARCSSSGWYECAFPAAYADFEALAARSAERGGTAPELAARTLGRRAAAARGARARNARHRGDRARAAAVRRACGRGAARRATCPRACSCAARAGARPRRWPPAASCERTLYLRGDGRANSAAGDGRLAEEPGEDRADTFVADPADPVPSLGGAAVAGVAGAVDQRPVEERGDVLCFTSEPLTAALEIAGRVRLALHAAATSRTSRTRSPSSSRSSRTAPRAGSPRASRARSPARPRSRSSSAPRARGSRRERGCAWRSRARRCRASRDPSPATRRRACARCTTAARAPSALRFQALAPADRRARRRSASGPVADRARLEVDGLQRLALVAGSARLGVRDDRADLLVERAVELAPHVALLRRRLRARLRDDQVTAARLRRRPSSSLPSFPPTPLFFSVRVFETFEHVGMFACRASRPSWRPDHRGVDRR